jgi:hypothetical protein
VRLDPPRPAPDQRTAALRLTANTINCFSIVSSCEAHRLGFQLGLFIFEELMQVAIVNLELSLIVASFTELA